MKCKNCKEKDGLKYSKYASGNFCSKLCARIYSSNYNRVETNKKISKSCSINKRKFLSIKIKDYKPDVILKCDWCKREFTKLFNKRNQNFCSTSCSSSFINSLDSVRDNLSKKRIEAIKLGKTNFNSVKCQYNFRGRIIQCDSKIEYACLDYIEKNYDVINIERCNFSIEYLDKKGKKHRFLPDFFVECNNGKIIVEAKSDIIINALNEKWHFYKETSELKKQALIEFCKLNNFEPFWFTTKLNRKFYNSLCSKHSLVA
jgi:hypothetical protein